MAKFFKFSIGDTVKYGKKKYTIDGWYLDCKEQKYYYDLYHHASIGKKSELKSIEMSKAEKILEKI